MTIIPKIPASDECKLELPADGKPSPPTQSEPPPSEEELNEIVVRRLRELGYL